MGGTMSEATKAPLTIEVGGREYILSPLELDDFGAAEKWMEMLPYDRARRKIAALDEVATEARQEKILAEADAESAALRFGTEAANARLSTIEGTGYMLWLSLRKRQPEMTKEDALHMISVDSLDEWQAALDRVSGLSEKVEDGEHPTEIDQPE